MINVLIGLAAISVILMFFYLVGFLTFQIRDWGTTNKTPHPLQVIVAGFFVSIFVSLCVGCVYGIGMEVSEFMDKKV